MRAIDADALKEDLTRFYDNEVTARKLIDEQPTIQPEPHWIPCSDRLPEEEGDYLVTVDPDYVPQGYRSTDVITWHNGKWIMADYFVLDGENRKKPEYKVIDFAMPIIAWMPLPEPWKGEQP